MNAGHETRTGLASALFALVLAVGMVLFAASPARADADTEACFLSKINAARAATGAQTLQRDTTLAGYGRIHSQAMAANGKIYHSSTGDLTPYLPSDWMMWGENVGVGGTCAVLFDAFMASPGHKENLLNPKFQYAGIGDYVDGNGTLWTTHVFLQRQTTSTTQPPTTTTAPPTTTTTAAATTTTKPATTTTTAAPPPTTTSTPATTTTTAAPPPTTTSTPATTTTVTEPPTTTSVATPTTTSTTRPVPPTTAGAPATTTTFPTTTTTTASAVATGLQTTTTSTVTGLAEGPTVAGSLNLAISTWQTNGILCSDAACGGDQLLLAFIGAVLLSGSVITTLSLRT